MTDNHTTQCVPSFSASIFLCYDSELVSSDPLKRLGIIVPCKDSLYIVACTFSAYHHMKFKHAPSLASSDHIIDGDCLSHNQQDACFESFADAFKAEAAEFRLSVRSFDLYSFRSFLVSSSRA